MHCALCWKADTDEFCHHGRRFPSLSYSRPEEGAELRGQLRIGGGPIGKGGVGTGSGLTLVVKGVREFVTHHDPDASKVQSPEMTERLSHKPGGRNHRGVPQHRVRGHTADRPTDGWGKMGGDRQTNKWGHTVRQVILDA